MNTSLSVQGLSKTVGFVAVLSIIGNAILTAAGRAVSAPPDTFGPYMYSSVIGLTLAGVIAAGVVYLLMCRYYTDTTKANRYFFWLSIFVLVASFYPDVAMPWSTDADQVGWTYGIMANLMLMHVLAAGLVLYYFPKAR